MCGLIRIIDVILKTKNIGVPNKTIQVDIASASVFFKSKAKTFSNLAVYKMSNTYNSQSASHTLLKICISIKYEESL